MSARALQAYLGHKNIQTRSVHRTVADAFCAIRSPNLPMLIFVGNLQRLERCNGRPCA